MTFLEYTTYLLREQWVSDTWKGSRERKSRHRLDSLPTTEDIRKVYLFFTGNGEIIAMVQIYPLQLVQSILTGTSKKRKF